MKHEDLTPAEQRAAELRAVEWEKLERDQANNEARQVKAEAARIASQQNVIKLPKLPERPPELAELIPRRAAIRAEWQGIEVELKRARDAAWRASQGGKDPTPETVATDAAIDRLVTGEAEPAALSVVPEQSEAKQSRMDFLKRADRKISDKIHEINQRHNRSVARALRPLHRHAVRRVHAALLELEQANSEEQAARGAVPGAPMQVCDFPNIGTRAPGVNSPINQWISYARRLGFLDEGEPEAGWPTAAL